MLIGSKQKQNALSTSPVLSINVTPVNQVLVLKSLETVLQIDKFYTVVKIVFELTVWTVVLGRSVLTDANLSWVVISR